MEGSYGGRSAVTYDSWSGGRTVSRCNSSMWLGATRPPFQGPQSGSWWVIAIGVVLLIYAVIGPRRALSLIEDALVGFPF